MPYCIWKDEKDEFKWGVCFFGPEGTPYEGGSFYVDVVFPPQFPTKPPELTMRTKIYHPCVHSKKKHPNFGTILLDLAWTPMDGGVYTPNTSIRES